ncbi:MAG TPA: lytic transglycosylase domain-containing protein [Acidobacteriaceae bacterium]|nr:lytic transglycosylase domain-containing protein [Acidobacteriaceae bacterium]
MRRFGRALGCVWLAASFAATAAYAAERVTLKNGFDLICDHRVPEGAKARLYMDAAGASYIEVNASDIVSGEPIDLAKPATAAVKPAPQPALPEKLTDADLQPMLAKAGTAYNLDADLLASVVRAESAGHSHAVSHAGAQGLMQLMPGTASDLGVGDTFAPKDNIQGGTAYLDWLLKRYNDNLQLALAAYNAGPAAVDRWHGIPPYRETRLYVARVIREYNRRYLQRHQAELRAAAR